MTRTEAPDVRVGGVDEALGREAPCVHAAGELERRVVVAQRAVRVVKLTRLRKIAETKKAVK